MLASSALLFLAISAAGVLAQRPNFFEPCNLPELATCQKGFNTILGIDAGLNVDKPGDLMDAVETIIANKGSSGLATICSAVKNFKLCFSNSTDYDRCMLNPVGLLANADGTATGTTEINARTYVKLYTSLDFACGAGYTHFQNSDDSTATKGCASAVFKNLPALRACQSNFERQSSQDPQDICEYAMQSAMCYSFTFLKCKEPGMWFGCEYQRSGLQSAYGECSQNFCKFNPPE